MPWDAEAVWSKRERLWEADYRPIAIYNSGKHPKGGGWGVRALADPPEAVAQPPDPDALSTGILCAGLRGADIDIDNPVLAAEVVGLAISILGPCMAVRCRENSPRRLLPYRAESGEPRKRRIIGEHGKVEILGAGQQFVAYGLHPSGAEILWQPDDLESVPRDDLTAVSEDAVGRFLAAVAPVIASEVWTGMFSTTKRAIPASEWRRRFKETCVEGYRNDLVTQQAGHLLRHGIDPYVALELLSSWNRDHCIPPLGDDEVLQIVNSICRREAARRENRNGR